MNRHTKYRSWAPTGIYNEEDNTILSPPLFNNKPIVYTVPEKYRGKFRGGQELRFISRIRPGKTPLATSIEPNYEIS